MSGPLRQAEVLRDIVEVRAVSAAWGSNGAVGDVEYVSQPHALAIVMTQDCDLEQDYFVRNPREGALPSPEDVDRSPNALQAVLLCDAYDANQMESYFPAKLGSKERELVRKNQNERYHCLDDGAIPDGAPIPHLMLDFRTPFAIPAAPLYQQLADDQAHAHRVGIIPPFHLHDLMHRFYSYHARVALPPVADEPDPPLLEAGALG